jgi:IPTL-CTERM motif
VVNDTTITNVVPSGSTGAVSVIVTNGIGSNAANTLYSYAIPTPTPTPTLGEWGMIAFAGLLVLFAIFKLRRVDKSATA